MRMYRLLVLTRALDRYLLRLQRMGKVALYAESLGEEAAMVGSALALRPEDVVFPSYRELGVYLTRGVPISEILDRQLNTVDDPLKGHEFAVFGDSRFNIVPAPTPVATQIPVAVGYALAFKIRGERRLAVTYFGDGATSKGDFHEGINFASVYKPPIVFICLNNQYAISTHVSRQTGAATIAQKAIAYGLSGYRVDGNDAIAMYLVSRSVFEEVREGGDPVLIEAVTYRLGAHTTSDDPKRYRSEEEVRYWMERDPIERMRSYLISKNVMGEEEDKALWAEVEALVSAEVEKALAKPGLDPMVIFEDVYAEPTPQLREQMEEFRQQLRMERVMRG
ncbi:MAG: thiamine pyrophosphate-dependent dehydrogenase E1 component subunit alpha [Nitrososphaerota archaeon]